jgi:hypothetical protein
VGVAVGLAVEPGDAFAFLFLVAAGDGVAGGENVAYS